MKNLFYSAFIALTVQSAAWAGPIHPMANYTPSNVSENNVQRIWSSMETRVKNDDCYRRAHIWAYEMWRSFGVKSTKIFMHYTNKWNYELDAMGGEFYGRVFGKIRKKTFDAPGITWRTRSMVRSNITWDYHVAPMIKVEGKDVVMDRTLRLAYDAKPGSYTEEQGWNLIKRPSTPEEWVEALTVRGEILWKARKALLRKQISEGKGQWARNKMRELGMHNKNRIDIKCKKVDSIADVDKNHKTAWCFYTEAPMYYYNELDLRYLAYGNTGYRYNMPPPLKVHTEQNYQNGRKYIQTEFNPAELRDAEKERY